MENLLVNTFTNIMISDTHTLNPTTILDMKVSYHRNNLQIADSSPGGKEAIAVVYYRQRYSGHPDLEERSGAALFPAGA